MNCLLCHRTVEKVIASKLRNNENGEVLYCPVCELGMLNNTYTEEGLKAYYNSFYRKQYTPEIGVESNPQELFDIYSKFQNNRIDIIKGYLNKDMRLLEIGCSAGMFLYHIKEHVREIMGIDYDSASASFAENKCSCKVYRDDIQNTDIEMGSLDIICILSTLEHVRNPYDLILNCKKHLKPKGLIYIEVPNLKDALLNEYDVPSYNEFYFTTAHLWYFTANSLIELMKKSGFQGERFYVQEYNIMNHFHWIDSETPQKDCIPGLSVPCFPLQKNVNSATGDKLNDFMKEIDFRYKEILINLGITSSVSFIGRMI